MMTVELECMYCGHKWEKVAYNQQSIESEVCRCGDSNLKVRDLQTAKIDAYKGCPPFPKKDKKEDSGWPWGSGGAFMGIDLAHDDMQHAIMTSFQTPPDQL